MATKPECPYCGKTTGLRQVHDGGGFTAPEYTCEGCFTATDDGPCFDDLPHATTPDTRLAKLIEAAQEYMAAVKALGEASGYNGQTYFEVPLLASPADIGAEAIERWEKLNDTGLALSAAISKAEGSGR